MRHVEPVESRVLFSALPVDPTFNGGKAVAITTGVDQTVLATHGSIWAFGFNQRRQAYYLYKFTDAGTLDTTWGTGGLIRPASTNGRHEPDALFHPQLVYDARNKELLLATGDGLSDDAGRTIQVERFNAAGAADAAWGDHGIVEITAKPVTLTVDRVLPLAGKKLAVAFKREDGPGDGTSDLYLTRFDRLGHRDKTFNAGKPVLVASGYKNNAVPADAGVYKTSDPVFGDLRATDTGFRVVSVRQLTRGRDVYHEDDDDSTFSGYTDWSVETVDVSNAGTASAPTATPLYHDVNGDRDNGRYRFVLAAANADGSASVLFGRENQAGDNLSAEVTRVTDGTVTSRHRLDGLAAVFDYNYDTTVFRNTDGITYVYDQNDLPTDRLNPDLTLDTLFAHNGDAFPGKTTAAVDDAGRLVTIVTARHNDSATSTTLRRYA